MRKGEGLDNRNIKKLDISISFEISVKEGETVKDALKTVSNISKLIGETMIDEHRLCNPHINLKVRGRS